MAGKQFGSYNQIPWELVNNIHDFHENMLLWSETISLQENTEFPELFQ